MVKIFNWKPPDNRKRKFSPFGDLPIRFVVCDNDSGQPTYDPFFDRSGYLSEGAAIASIAEYYTQPTNEFPEGLFIRQVIFPKGKR